VRIHLLRVADCILNFFLQGISSAQTPGTTSFSVRHTIGSFRNAELNDRGSAGEFKKAYPTAKLIAPAAAVARVDQTLAFDGVWGRDPPDTKYGFEDDVCIVLSLPRAAKHRLHRSKHGNPADSTADSASDRH
jgi:hypothetical protein